MRDIAATLRAWMREGRPFALASLIGATGSAPRPLGTALAVDADGTVVGGVSGGCVDGAAYLRCQEVLDTGAPALESFGYSDEDAFAVGLTCGGTMDLLIVRIGGPATAPDPPAAEAATRADGTADPSRGSADQTATRPGTADADGRAAASTARPGGDAAPATKDAADISGAALNTAGPGSVYATGPAHTGGPDDAAIAAALDAILEGRPVTLVRAVEGPDLGAAAAVTARAAARGGAEGAAHGTAQVHTTGRLDIDAADLPATSGRFGPYAVEVHAPPPRLLVYGAVDFAGPLVRIGKELGNRVTVCDARPVFATAIRFPEADEVLVDWPHRHFEQTAVDADTAVCVLTHDAKFDVPLLERALVSEAGYVGAMGSRPTNRDRLQRLRDAGLPEDALARLRSPIGLDLNGRTAEETALSILAEVTAVRNRARAGFLTGAEGPIHH